MKIEDRPFSPSDTLRLIREGVPPVLARALAARAVTSKVDAMGSVERLLPYSQLLGTVELAAKLADAIEQKQRLLIVADYDADGATACAVGLLALRAMGANVDYIVPNRLEQGYGLTPDIARIVCSVEPKPDYIVTVDNGIAANDGIDECNRLGVPVLVTDHHLPGEKRPAVDYMVNPNQHGCTFPSKALAGCGVMWYVMWALQDELVARGIPPVDPDFEVHQLLPIVAVGTVADVVPLDLNNRILVNEGLKAIREGRGGAGINALAAVSQFELATLSTSNIAFGIAPRINAAGRLETMDVGIACLVEQSADAARALAEQLHDINVRRKEVESEMTDEAVRRLLSNVKEDRYTATLYEESWHQGVIGIVAGRIKEMIYRPTFVMAVTPDGKFKGSGRSIPGFHLRDALVLVDRKHPGLLVKYGGHAMAAGVTVRAGGFELFSEAFEEVARTLISPVDLVQVLPTDGSLDVPEISIATVSMLKQQVWGQAFPEPIFLDRFRVINARMVGEKKNHLSMYLERDGARFQAMKFRTTDTPPLPGTEVKLAYKLDARKYQGEDRLQLLVEAFG